MGSFQLLTAAEIPQLVQIDSESGPLPWSVQQFLGEFSNSASRVFGIRINEKVIGFLVLHTVLPEANILNFAISPSMRRRGYGRALLLQVLSQLSVEGVEYVFLEVRVGNQAAIQLYETCGFRAVGRRKSFYSDNGEDALTMRAGLFEFVNSKVGTASQLC